MGILGFYLLGFAIVWVCSFLWGYFFEERKKHKIMWWVYQSTKIAFFSWFAIIILIALGAAMMMSELDDYITRYLDK